MMNGEMEEIRRLHKQNVKFAYALHLTLEAIFEKSWEIEGIKKEMVKQNE